jgi:hypothetical protein
MALLLATLTGCTTITEELPIRPSDVPTPPPILEPGPPPTPAPPGRTPKPNPKPPQPPPPTNDSKVAKLGMGVIWVACNGVIQPNSEGATSAKVGCQIYFDSIAKDANNRPTQSNGTPRWDFAPSSIVRVNHIDPWQPIATGTKPGLLVVNATCDGIAAKTVRIQLYK